MELPPTWFVLVSSSVMGLITRHQAKKNGRNPKFWFWVGFFLGGLGIFAFFLTNPLKKQSKAAQPIFPKVNLFQGAWYYAEGQSILGPFSSGYIQKLLDEEQISLETLVWHESMHEWEKLEKFKDKH